MNLEGNRWLVTTLKKKRLNFFDSQNALQNWCSMLYSDEGKIKKIDY